MNRTIATSPPTARPWLLLSIIAAALAMAGSVITLLSQRLYDMLTAVADRATSVPPRAPAEPSTRQPARG